MRAKVMAGILALAQSTVASPVIGQQRFADPRPTAEELWQIATVLAKASEEMDTIWPGFWSPNDGFLLISPHGGMLLIASWEAPDPFVARAPIGESYRAYEAEGSLPGYSGGRFPGTHELDGRVIYALPPMGRSPSSRIGFYVHEAFHFWQRGEGAWAETPEDSITGLSPEKFITDPTVLTSQDFAAALEREDSLLLEIASSENPELIRRLLGEYLAARPLRLKEYPDIEAVERRYERREGTAEYVGCRAAVLATRGTRNELVDCITEELQDESTEIVQLIRWRLYSSGAVISDALDRLGVRDWKGAIASGMRLDEIAAREIRSS